MFSNTLAHFHTDCQRFYRKIKKNVYKRLLQLYAVDTQKCDDSTDSAMAVHHFLNVYYSYHDLYGE